MLHYQTYIKSPEANWVVFIRGAGGSIKTWDYQVSDFKKYCNLLLIDLRDHGVSKNVEPQQEKYDFKLISQDI